MASSYRHEEERIQRALDAIKDAPNPNISQVARTFNCNVRRLRYRWKTGKSKITEGGKNKRLDNSQSKALCRILDRLDRTGLPATIPMLRSIGNHLLLNVSDSETPPQPLGPLWAKRWLTAHPKYKIKKGKPLAILRKLAHNPINVTRWMEDEYWATRQKYGILDEDCYNMDQTGCRIGVGRARQVITTSTSNPLIADPDNREYITVVECISGSGWAIEPMVILSQKVLRDRDIVAELTDDTILGCSTSGYVNDNLCLRWLHHFDVMTRHRCLGAFRLLLFDGYGSHLLFPFIDYCWKNGIIPLCLPAHITHLMQPLDVRCFQPWKHYHSEAIDQVIRTGAKSFEKVDFLTALRGVREATFKESTVRSAWRATGLIPYNPQVVLDQLQQIKDKANRRAGIPTRPSTPNQDVTAAQYIVPTKPSEIHTLARQLQFYLDQSDLPEAMSVRFKAFFQGTSELLVSGAYAEWELGRNTAAEAARNARSTSRRQISKDGVIYVKDARHRKKEIILNEEAQAQRVLDRAQKKRDKATSREQDMIEKASRKAIREARAKTRQDVKASEDTARLQREAYRARIDARFGTHTCFQRRPRRIVDEADD
jgi:cell division septum initiation protein DivIVA